VFLEALTFIREEFRPDLMVFVQRLFTPGHTESDDLEGTPAPSSTCSSRS
jgi:hypothetical protein